MPRLSVLMPAYNAASTITAAVRSTLRDLPQDAELVVLDDGSDDGTANAAQAAGDSRVRVISRQNAGVAASLNELLAATDSELIARMDADDLVLRGRFRRQMRSVAQGADVVFTTVLTWGDGRPALPRMNPISAEAFPLHLLLTNPVAHSTMLGRRSSVEAVGGYRRLPTEDYDLWLRLASSGARMTRLAVPSLAYRVHPGQVTASSAWRRSSWENRQLGDAFSQLAEKLLGMPATRFTTLSIDETLTTRERLDRAAEFSAALLAASDRLPHAPRRTLRRKLAQRNAWFEQQLNVREDVAA